MRVYLNERRTDIKIVTDGAQFFIIPNPPEDPDFIKETQESLKKYQNGEFEDMSVDEFLKGLRKW
ncbi:hypothetical protein [Methanobacterium sp.]|uniref:hypothetical protein n=1 Tax=Methanobacterium sp. TaxID=2164 RepID=UPI003C79684F